MRRWEPLTFMQHSDVRRLVSYVESRGYYTEDDKRALVLLAECGMPPWIAAAKMYQWLVTGQSVSAGAHHSARLWRDAHPQQEAPAGRYDREAFLRYIREAQERNERQAREQRVREAAAQAQRNGTYTFNFADPTFAFMTGPDAAYFNWSATNPHD